MPDDAATTTATTCCYAADVSAMPPLPYSSPPNNRFGDTNKTNLNGSIITLTMKNNHLIVETEERVPVNDDDDDPPTFNRPFKIGFTPDRPQSRRFFSEENANFSTI